VGGSPEGYTRYLDGEYQHVQKYIIVYTITNIPYIDTGTSHGTVYVHRV